MISKPDNSEQVYETMVAYCSKKQYTFPDKFLRFMAEECFLTGESKGWSGCKYWPAFAMKWVLRNTSKQVTKKIEVQSPTKIHKETIRDKLLRDENS